jgi:hypothetical protein
MRSILFLLCAFIAATAGCVPATGTPHPGESRIDLTDPSHPPVGQGMVCTLQFKRNLLGAGANLPVAPMTTNINGADVSVRGKLVRFDREWIVLEVEGHTTLWVPTQNVLLVQW